MSMNRRELLSKLGLVALLPVTAYSGMTSEPKESDGEWYLTGMPTCPNCGMVMDQSRLRAENGQILIRHPSTMWDGKKWPCKNAGKTFAIPIVRLEEYRGKVSEEGGFPIHRE